MFLVGVFLDEREPADPAPERLDFSTSENYSTLSPLIGQVFFIGDGRSASGARAAGDGAGEGDAALPWVCGRGGVQRRSVCVQRQQRFVAGTVDGVSRRCCLVRWRPAPP